MPSDKLEVIIEYHDGQEDGDMGFPYYVASCPAIGGVTDGRTLAELLENLREMIALALADDDTVSVYNVIPHPRISIVMDLPDYAQIT